MALTKGVVTTLAITSSLVALSATAATAGVGTVTYQWYRSTASGFTPGGGNILAGKTSLALEDDSVLPNTKYFYKLVATDEDSPPEEVEYDQVEALTDAPVLSQNQFKQEPLLGVVDLQFPSSSFAMQAQQGVSAAALRVGQPVKVLDVAGGVPKVTACDAITDKVDGYINYNMKNASFAHGAPLEVSRTGAVMWLIATAAIPRFADVVLDITTIGGVLPATGNNGRRIVGKAYDKAAARGDVIRVELNTSGALST